MSSWFILTLDTTPPVVTIDCDNTVMPGIVSEIYINASESIAEYQDIYIIDSQSTRHDVTFQYQPENNRYYGELNFAGYATGLATVYARLKDKVDNLSSLTTKVINIQSTTIDNFIQLYGKFTEEIVINGYFEELKYLFGKFIKQFDLISSFDDQKELYGQFIEEINKLGRW